MKAISSFFRNLITCLFLTVLLAQMALSGAVSELSGSASVIAVNAEAASQKAEQASEKVKQDDAIKTKFGETEEGDRMIDKARDTAQEKLKTLAEKSQKEQNLESLPPHEKNFLENLKGDSNE